MSDEVLTVQEVARYLKLAPKTVYALVSSGELRSFRVGRAVRCRKVDVEAFITARALGGEGDSPPSHESTPTSGDA